MNKLLRIFVVLGLIGSVFIPSKVGATSYWMPTPTAPIHWQWQIGTDFTYPTDLVTNVTVYDVDGFNTSQATVTALHALGYKVIAYFSFGTYENWRDDAGDFESNLKGNSNGWAGENWLDISNLAELEPIMSARIALAASKGFDAIEPDNIDGYSNDTGFSLTAGEQLTYNEWIASAVHSAGMSVGLKNDIEQVPTLEPYFDWCLNEQSYEYDEYSNLSDFVNDNKAVFEVEYGDSTPQASTMNSLHINSMTRNLDLTAPSDGGYVRIPCIPDTQSGWTAGNTYYVSKAGNDSHTGLAADSAHAWLTIQHAANVITGGDTCYIEVGTYSEGITIQNLTGSSDSYTTFENYNGGTVIINGTNTVIPIYIVNCSYLTIEGLQIENAPSAGIQASYGIKNYLHFINLNIHDTGSSAITVGHDFITDPTSHILISGVTTSNTNTAHGDEGISIGAVNTFEVKDCVIYHTNGQDSIDAKGGCTNGLIHNNECYGTGEADGGSIYVDGGYTASGTDTSNINIYNNLLHDMTAGIHLCVETGDAQLNNINIYNNIIYNCRGGFSTDPIVGEVINFSFINNTLYNNGDNSYGGFSGVALGTSSGELSNCIIRNNIIVSTLSGAYAIKYSDYPTNVTVDHNLFYNSGGTWNAGNVLGTSSQSGNPNLLNPTTSFVLTASSTLAIGTGSHTDAPATDYIGTNRANPPCIGAYEYIPANPTVATGTSSSITANSASVGEEITDINSSNVTAWGTNYGTSTFYGLNSSNSGTVTSGDIPYSWSDSLGSLSAATKYHYRGFATNSTGTGYGADATFLTLPNSPTALSPTAGNTQVSFTWTKASGGSGTTIYTCIRYSTVGYPSSYSDGSSGITWTTGQVGTVTGLTNGTLYYFSAFTKAVNTLTTYSTVLAAGNEAQTTPTGSTTTTTTSTTTPVISVPTISLSGVTSITNTSAIIHGQVSNTGGDNLTVVIYWDTSNDGQGTWKNGDFPDSPSQPQGAVAFTYAVSGLSTSTTYYYTATGTNSAGTAWASPTLHFTTTGSTTTTTTTTTTTSTTSTTTTAPPSTTPYTPATPQQNQTNVIGWIPLIFAAGIVLIIIQLARSSSQSNMIGTVITIAILITIGLILLKQVNLAISL